MPDTPPLPPISEAPVARKKSIFHTLATFCLASPFIAILLNLLVFGPNEVQHPSHTREEALAQAMQVGLVPLLGILAGIISLFGMIRHGARGILWKAALGLLIYAFLILSAMHTFAKIQEVARKRHEQQLGHPPP
jgi:hypothetical protein